MYVTTTRDFLSFSDTKLFLDPGFSVIDAVIVKRGHGDYVLVLKDNTRPERNLRVAFGKTALGPWSNISKPFTESFTEGPTVLSTENKWVIYFDSYNKNIYEARATTDFVTFTDYNRQVSLPKGHKHGTVVPVSRKTLQTILHHVSLPKP
jgi:hypothetical protein